jgi:peptide/nickel transport system substrate-binding protein
MQKKRSLILVFLALMLVLGFGAVNAQDEGTAINIAWPYQIPPDGHFNSFASNVINLGGNTYQDLMEPPLAVYMWSSGVYEGMLADTFGFDEDNNYVVTLKSGVMWSDGTPVTAQDVVTTFNTGYLIGMPVWSYIDGVEAVDDLTARFIMSAPSPLAEYRILITQIRPTSVYGTFAERAQAFIEAGTASGDADFDAALTELTEFRPEQYVSAGPYVLLPENVSDANVVLVKNEGGLNADVVLFDRAVVWNGETDQVTPLVSNGDLWYATHGFPPATEAAFVEQGIDIVRGPAYSGPALYVNHSVAPLDRPEVRQAMAYAINREQNGFVSLGESGIAVDCMCGFSDNLTPLWLSDETLDALNPYDYDTDMAAQLLEGIGFSKGDDGVWMDDQGNRMAFELIFPAEFLDWAAAAENATQQLNDFGFEITARGVQFQQQQQDVYDSNFQLAIRNWGAASPFPGQSYLEPYNRYNGQGELAGEGVGGGMRFDVNVTYSGGTLNVYDVSVQSGEGLDVDAQKALVEQLAVSYNELLPAIPLWERYGNNPLNREFVTAPAGDDPIYNNAGADHFMPYLIMTGGIGPAGS